MKRLVALSLAMITLVGTARAAGEMPIFKDFFYGMTMDAVKGKVQVEECEKTRDGSEILCGDGYEFLGMKWVIKFAFPGNKLDAICLVNSTDKNKVLGVIQALSKTFRLVSVHGDDGMFDFVSAVKEKSEPIALDMMAKFVSTASRGSFITYSFFEGQAVDPLLRSSANITDLIKKSPDSLRVIEVENLATGKMIIRFYVAKAAIRDSLNSIPDVQEKF